MSVSSRYNLNLIFKNNKKISRLDRMLNEGAFIKFKKQKIIIVKVIKILHQILKIKKV